MDVTKNQAKQVIADLSECSLNTIYSILIGLSDRAVTVVSVTSVSRYFSSNI